MKLFMFVLRLSHSGKAAHIAYANQAQESFLDGHVRAFDTFGGVPTGMIRYDNLTPAVIGGGAGARTPGEPTVHRAALALRLRLLLLLAWHRRGA
jgi:transposase